MMKNLSLLLVFAFASLLFSCSDKQESNSDKEENNTENKKMQSMPEECNSSQLSFSATVNDSLIEVQNFRLLEKIHLKLKWERNMELYMSKATISGPITG